MPPLITVERFGPFQASIVTSPGQITASIISFVLPYTTLADPQISLSLYINYLISLFGGVFDYLAQGGLNLIQRRDFA
jgi:hypothetical protein